MNVSEFEGSDFTKGDAGKAEREGLPAGYRMRADAHYVEQLSSIPAARAERPRPEATRPAERDRRLLDQLSEDIAAIESAAAMLTTGTSPLARRVSLDLIKAQAARAAWVLRAQALSHEPESEPIVRPRPIGAMLARLRDRLGPECRLVGVGLQVSTDDQSVVMLDEATLSLGITGAVMALLGLLANTEGAVIRVHPAVEGGHLQSVDIAQDSIPLSASAQQRFFDAGWVERPGGWLAATGAATTSLAAERLRGRASLVTLDKRGCTISMRLA